MNPNDFVNSICAPENRSTLYTLAAMLVPVAASLLANARNYVPAWLEKVIDVMALNFVHKGDAK